MICAHVVVVKNIKNVVLAYNLFMIPALITFFTSGQIPPKLCKSPPHFDRLPPPLDPNQTSP